MERFARQYLMVKDNSGTNHFPNWNVHKIGEYRLSVHPDLPVYTHQNKTHKLVLIGIAFNIHDHHQSEQDFLETAPETKPELFEHLDSVSGNFALFVLRGDDLELYNDAAASMKLFYHVDQGSVRGVASDPKLLQHVFDLKKTTNEEAIRFYNSETFLYHRIWIGSLTYYDSVHQVLPNHYLSVKEAKTHRFFPRESLPKLNLDESIETVKGYFDEIVKGISGRYKMHCALTGGWDSRMVLAALKNYGNEASYFTFKRFGRSVKEADFKIPQAISEAFGLDYKIFEFDEEFPENESLRNSYEHYGPRRFNHIQQGYKHFDFKKDIALLGTVSEICKNYYDNVAITNGKTFAQAAHYPVVPYVVDWFQKKHDELKPFEKYGYDLRDLGHWEQDITNFAAQDALHSLSHVFTFPIFNNRKIITSILAMPRSMREKQEHQYYKIYLDAVWPELNEFPINLSSKKRLIVLAKKVGVYNLYKMLSTRLRK